MRRPDVPATSARVVAGPQAVLLGLLLGVGVLLRLLAGTGDLWLDEVWSLAILEQLRLQAGPFGPLLAIFHDNTHPLNSLWLALVGAEAAPYLQRLLGIASSVAALGVAVAIGWRRSRAEALSLACLLGLCYPLLAIGTEARGYGPLMLAALVAFREQDRMAADAATPGRTYVAACLLGLLSHYTFLFVLAGLASWTAWRALAAGLGPTAVLRRLWRFYRWPALLLLLGLALLVPGMLVGGGEAQSAPAQLALFLRLLLGLDGFAAAGNGHLLLLLALLLAALLALGRLAVRGDDSVAFFAVVVVAAPLALATCGLVGHVQPRYFLSAGLFGLVLAARSLGDWLCGHRGLALAAMAAMLAYAVGQADLLAKFFGPLRGQYGAAIRAMAGEGPATVAAAGGFRPQFALRRMLAHHANGVDGLTQTEGNSPAGTPPDWCILEIVESKEPMASIDSCILAAYPYKLAGSYPAWGLSGTGWLLYRRQ